MLSRKRTATTSSFYEEDMDTTEGMLISSVVPYKKLATQQYVCMDPRDETRNIDLDTFLPTFINIPSFQLGWQYTLTHLRHDNNSLRILVTFMSLNVHLFFTALMEFLEQLVAKDAPHLTYVVQWPTFESNSKYQCTRYDPACQCFDVSFGVNETFSFHRLYIDSIDFTGVTDYFTVTISQTPSDQTPSDQTTSDQTTNIFQHIAYAYAAPSPLW